MSLQRTLVWLRRDLRLHDNAALYRAEQDSEAIIPVFVLAPSLLKSDTMGAPIVQFFFHALQGLRTRLQNAGSDLVVLEGDFEEELLKFADSFQCDALYFNRDTDPTAITRDKAITEAFETSGRTVASFVDQVYFPHESIKGATGKSYTVFTPYKRRWLAARDEHPLRPFPSERFIAKTLLGSDLLPKTRDIPTPEEYGYTSSPNFPIGNETTGKSLVKHFLTDDVLHYQDRRNFPAIKGTSQISPHLRAGTVGIRSCIEAAFERRSTASSIEQAQVDTWISECIWRDFYHQILMHFPQVAEEPFDERGKHIRWIDDERGFAAWCEGRTGFPIVDAAMRQLNTYGWMHNRLRMIVASFLTKDLMIHWKYGERYFEQHLADADLAANNGGWQWSASTGTDSAPYFRVFNPTIQGKTYDPDGDFIRAMIPELTHIKGSAVHEPRAHSTSYPAPIVDHASARLRALERYGAVFGRAVKS